jgi:exodeoxyribonuclease V alpha subunit
MSGVIEVKARVAKRLYYSQDSMFGVFSFYPIETSEEIKINPIYGNFVVSGNCPAFIEDKEYEFTMKPKWNKKYGDGYEFVNVKQLKLDTVEAQQDYLRQLVTEKDAKVLIDAYPNIMIVDYIKEDKIDVNKLKGIKEARLRKIKDRLVQYETISVALVELKDLGISLNSLQRLINHFGSQEMLIQKVKESIYSLCEVDMFAFKTVDKYAMKRGDDPKSPYRVKACFEHVIKENGNDGHTWILVDDLIVKSEELLKVDTQIIIDILKDIRNDKQSQFYIDDEKISLKIYYHYEKEIKRHLDRLMKTFKSPNSTKNISAIEDELGITFTDEQKEAIKLSQQNGVFILNGKAGTGKTTTVKGIVESTPLMFYRACALSGKAAKVLDSKGINASTIHRLLGVGKDGRFYYGEEEMLPHDRIILDESSMVNTYLVYSLLKAIPDGSQIIFVGDNGQLPPIGLGSVFDDLLNNDTYPKLELTKVHRQAEKSGILSSANLIRDGHKINGRYDYSQQKLGELQDMTLIPLKSREYIFDYVIEIAKGYANKFGKDSYFDFQVLTPLKKRGDNSVEKLNIALQKVFNDSNDYSIKRGIYEYKKNDKIIHIGNNYEANAYKDFETYMQYEWYEPEELEEMDFEDDLPFRNVSVFNGTMGRIVHINPDKKEVLIQFEDIDGLVCYGQQELNNIELAYAITVHRSQGMGIKHVLFILDYVAYKMLVRELVYTGITRASEQMVLLCENGALHKAIENVGTTRNTFLKELLRGD